MRNGPRPMSDSTDFKAGTDCGGAARAPDQNRVGRLEQMRCVLFWPWAFRSPSVLPPMPQGCITPNRDMSSRVPASPWIRAFRRSSRTRPPATTIHPDGVAADPRHVRGSCSAVGLRKTHVGTQLRCRARSRSPEFAGRPAQDAAEMQFTQSTTALASRDGLLKRCGRRLAKRKLSPDLRVQLSASTVSFILPSITRPASSPSCV